jgi:hypothetical protein
MRRGNTFFFKKNERQKMRKADYSFTIFMAFKAALFLVGGTISVVALGSDGGYTMITAGFMALVLTPLMAFVEGKAG